MLLSVNFNIVLHKYLSHCSPTPTWIHIRTRQLAVPANLGNELNFARLRRSAANTSIFYSFIILCYSPVFIEMTIPLSESRENPRGFGATAVFMNSSINPILYSWRLLEFRMAVVKLAPKMFCKH